MRRAVLLVCIVILVLAVDIGFVFTALAAEPEQYCVGFEKGSRKAVKDAITVNFGNVIKKEFNLVDVVVVSLPPGNAKKLSEIPGVIRIVPDRVWIEFEAPPPGKGKPKEGEKLPWGVDRIDADKVWDTDGDLVVDEGAITGSGIKVVVLDTGIDYEHEDLSVAGGFNTVEGQDPNYPDDEYGHGTICAGVIAALDNDVGYIGVAPGVELYAVKLCGAVGELPLHRLYAGMEWCIDPDGDPNTSDEMQVVSMSFSIWTGDPNAGGQPLHDPIFCSYIQQADAAGIALVAAATNDKSEIEIFDPQTYVPGSMSYRFPACYLEVVAVSATGYTTKGKPSERGDYFASFSNYGSAIEVAAPGVLVETTANGGGYRTASGTSLSCPHVAGVAALILEKFGVSTTPDEVRAKLTGTAEYLTKLEPQQQGSGLVDAGYAIVTQRAPRRPPVISKLATTWGYIRNSK